jgi:hypothetical protein
VNTYVAFWNNQTIEIEAATSYDAQLKAASVFQAQTRRKVKSYQVTVQLIAKDGEPVETSTGSL